MTQQLIFNLCMLVSLSVLSGLLDLRVAACRWKPLCQGVLFGTAAVLGMLWAAEIRTGLIFDGRSVMVSLAGLYFGPVAAGVSALMTIALRVSMGGPGMVMGIAVIAESAVIGILFHRAWIARGQAVGTVRLLGFGLLVHVAMIGCMGFLPVGQRESTFRSLALPVLTIYPLATILAGSILAWHGERARFVEALRESGDKYRLLVENQNDLIVKVDREGKFLFVSPSYCELFGKTEAELLGSHFMPLVHEQDRAVTVAAMEDLFREPWRCRVEQRALTAGGWRWLEWSDRAVLDGEGNVIAIIAVGRDLSEAKRQDAALRASENRYRELVDLAADGILAGNQDARIVDANAAVCAMFGLSAEELLGRHITELPFEPESLRASPFDFRRVNSGEIVTSERAILRPDGSVIPIEMRSKRMPDGGYQSILRDITERRRAESALRESLQTSADLARSIPSGLSIYRFEKPDRLIHMESNAAALRILGLDAEACHEREFSELWPWSRSTALKDHLLETVRTGAVFETESVPYGSDLVQRICRVRAFVLPGGRLAVLFDDITEAKCAERRLRKSEERFRAIFNASFQFIGLLTPDGIMLESNQASLDHIQASPEDVRGRAFWETPWWVGDDERIARLRDAIARAAQGEFIRYEEELRNVDGKATRIDFSLKPVFGEMGRVVLLVPEARDVTESKRLEDRLRHMEKMDAVGQLAGGIAHDFNNQLGGVLGFAEMLLRKLDDPVLRDYAQCICTAAQRSAELTRMLLAFARKGQYLTMPVDVHGVVREVAAILRHSIDKRIRIRLETEAASAIVLGDATQIQNALLNLALNARDAMPDGGEIIFRTSVMELDESFCGGMPYDIAPGPYLCLDVADTGCGIPKGHFAHLFEPFFTTKEVGRGTGMGLAAVYGTVKQHGGAIAVTSEMGHGTTFRIHLPLATGVEPALPAPAPAAELRATRTARILLIDDEPFIRAVAGEMLTDLGHTVVLCENGAEGLAYFREHGAEIDLVILDIIMPVMNGPDTFRALRALNPNVRVLVASGYGIAGSAEALLREGVLGFIQKPFRLDSLAATVAQALEA